MTERIKGVLVTFEKDIRGDDAEAQINAIRQIRGVLSVDPVPASMDDYMAEQRVKFALWDKMREVFFPEWKS